MLVGVSTYCFRNQFLSGQHDLFSFLDKCRDILGAVAVEILQDQFAPAVGDEPIRGFAHSSQVLRTPEYLQALADRAREAGVVISAVSARGDFAQESEARRDAEVAELKEWVDITARLGVPTMRVYGASRHEGMTFERSKPWIVAGLREVAACAATRGVKLGMEDHGAITAVSQVRAIVEAVDSPAFGVLMDVGNLQHFGEDPVAAAKLLAPWVVHVHLKESRRQPDGSLLACAVGEGDIDIPAVLRALSDGGYEGCLAIEYGAQVDEDEIVRRSIAYTKQVLRDL
jgi:sugar phosphate isomerase/epimerase